MLRGLLLFGGVLLHACSSTGPPADSQVIEAGDGSPDSGDQGLTDGSLDQPSQDTQPVDSMADAAPDPTGTLWAVRAGGGENDYAQDLVLDKADNAYVAGYFKGTAHFGPLLSLTSKGMDDGIVAKLDPAGSFLWAVRIGGTGQDYAKGLFVDSSGNLLVVGKVSSGKADFGTIAAACTSLSCPYIATFDPTGKLVGLQVLSSLTGAANAIAEDAKGNRYLAGQFYGSGQLGTNALQSNGQNDGFIAKIDSSSNISWAFNGGGPKSDGFYDVALTSTGVLATTWSEGSATFGGKTLTGDTVHLLSVNSSGTVLWATKVAPAMSWGDLALDAAGNARVAGNFMGTAGIGTSGLTSKGKADALVGAFSGKGAPLWGASGGGVWIDSAFGVAISAGGLTYLTGFYKQMATFGTFTLTGTGTNDVFVVGLDPLGKVKSAVAAHTTSGNCTGQAISVDSKGALVVAGSLTSDLSCGPYALKSAGQSDLFVWKLSPK